MVIWSRARTRSVIRIPGGLGPQEAAFLEVRSKVVQRACSGLLDVTVPEGLAPRIAIVGSGGGIRSGATFSGFLARLEEVGIMDATTYVCGVSGSAYPLTCWLWTGTRHIGDTVSEIWGHCRSTIFENIHWLQLALLGLTKKVFRQEFNFVDVWGFVHSNKLEKSLFGETKSAYSLDFLHAARDLVASGDVPFPIVYTSLAEEVHAIFEFNVFEAGCKDLGGFIPTEYVGSVFFEGRLIKQLPTLTLSLLNSVLGALFSFSFRQLYEALAGSDCGLVDCTSLLYRTITLLGRLPLISRMRLAVARIPNLMYHYIGPYKRHKYLTFIDGAFYFNIASAPAFAPERGIDIIVVLSVSTLSKEKDAADILRGARAMGNTMPPLAYTQDAIDVFEDLNSSAPTILYVKIPDEIIARHDVLKLDYINTEITELWDAGVLCADEISEVILDAMRRHIASKTLPIQAANPVHSCS